MVQPSPFSVGEGGGLGVCRRMCKSEAEIVPHPACGWGVGMEIRLTSEVESSTHSPLWVGGGWGHVCCI